MITFYCFPHCSYIITLLVVLQSSANECILRQEICSKRASADEEACEYFVDELKKTIRDEQIPYELVYNVDETSPFCLEGNKF